MHHPTTYSDMTTPIPSPPSVPFLGHTQSLDRDVPLHSYHLLSKQYGEIYRLDLVGAPTLTSNTI